MKIRNFTCLRMMFLLGLFCTFNISCERDLSDEAEFASFPNTAEVFIDGFSGGLEYLPFGGSKLNAFSVDTETKYEGTSSMRFDVPNFGDPAGAFAGAIFPDYNGRNLSEYDALTFWAKATQAATINEIGFGVDFEKNKFAVTRQNLRITTTWTKYVIPIPDPLKLDLEKGMFWYAAGPENNNGFTFWIDELQYESLGTIAQPKPAILNGEDVIQTSFIGSSIDLTSGLSQTFNLGSGINETVLAAPSYFTFSSTDPDVARVSELGIVSIVGNGSAVITAILDGVKAKGSLSVEVIGQFTPAPIPPYDPDQVISIFSDVYTNVPVDFYNGFYAPFQTTTSNDFAVNGDNVLNYENYNFVGIEFNQNVPTINASSMTKMHLDIFIPNGFDPESTLRINLVDFGADDAFGGGDNSTVSITLSTNSTPALVTGDWISVDLDITALANRKNLGQIVFDASGDTSPRPSSFYVDNIYLYK
ncbi:glycosyl hydrolase family 16 [Namhaeicola litoreus]|uniref:Glycosyl hydrolase family 16 n=1 Tax=Namhaeicola litoreus TaxID=1052145 RepID=A0ABW3Y3S9_9FLAO